MLLVEGPDDKHVVLHIRDRIQELKDIPEFEILDKDGIYNLLPVVRSEAVASGRLVLGIVVDANDHLEQRWEQLRGRLSSADIELPPLPDPYGTIVDGVPRRPRVGVWLMPDNEVPGELEDFVQTMIPPADPVWPRSKQYIDDIPSADRRFGDKVTRAKVHAWLAAREDPRLMGTAIRAGDLQTDGELAQRFAGWLGRLFE